MSDDVPPFYALLEVETDATRDEILAQYRELVKEYHPDQSGSEEEFKRLQSAKDALQSAAERRRYDRLGHETYVERVDPSGWPKETTEDAQQTHQSSSTTTSSDPAGSDDRNKGEREDSSTANNQSNGSTTGRSHTTGRRSAETSSSADDNRQQTSQSRSKTTESQSQTSKSYTSGSTTRESSRDWNSKSAATSGSSFTPRILLMIVLSVVVSIPLAAFSGGQSSVTAGIAVGLGFGIVFSRDFKTALSTGISGRPQLPADTAALLAGISGVGTVVLLAAVMSGSPNGGLLLARFVGVFMFVPVVVVGIVTFGVLASLTRSPTIVWIGSALVSLVWYFVEFTPHRMWFPFFSDIQHEPASTIAPWVASGSPTGYALGWAINVTLAIVLFVSLVVSLLTLVVGFTYLLRGGTDPDLETLGWELFAAVPVGCLTWWSLAGNRVWALHGMQPESATAVVLVMAVCVCPTIVFGLYALVARLKQ